MDSLLSPREVPTVVGGTFYTANVVYGIPGKLPLCAHFFVRVLLWRTLRQGGIPPLVRPASGDLYTIERGPGLFAIGFVMRSITVSRQGKGEVEADETFIGGEARTMRTAVKQRRITGFRNMTAASGRLV